MTPIRPKPIAREPGATTPRTTRRARKETAMKITIEIRSEGGPVDAGRALVRRVATRVARRVRRLRRRLSRARVVPAPVLPAPSLPTHQLAT